MAGFNPPQVDHGIRQVSKNKGVRILVREGDSHLKLVVDEGHLYIRPKPVVLQGEEGDALLDAPIFPGN